MDKWSVELRRYIASDPFRLVLTHRPVPEGSHTRRRAFRVELLAGATGTTADTVRLWALGQKEPTVRQRELVNVFIINDER